MTLPLREGSQYEHDDLGIVRLVAVDEDAEEVLLECESNVTYVRGVGHIPSGTRESIASFTEQAEPAPISVSPPAAEMDADGSLRP